MFYAFSIRKQRIVNIGEVDTTDTEFGCVNRNCPAKIRVRAENSHVVQPHFYCLRTSPHSPDCIYNSTDNKYCYTNNFNKYSPEHILEQCLHKTSFQKTKSTAVFHTDKQSINIHTPRQLLEYCIVNPLNTPYTGNCLVNDIILDKRNATFNAISNYDNQIRLAFGVTQSYESKEGYIIYFGIPSQLDENKFLINLKVVVTDKISAAVNNYIFGNKRSGKFRGYPIAVFGRWKASNKHLLETTIVSPKQIIYRF